MSGTVWASLIVGVVVGTGIGTYAGHRFAEWWWERRLMRKYRAQWTPQLGTRHTAAPLAVSCCYLVGKPECPHRT